MGKNIWYLNHYAGSSNSARYGRPYYLGKACINKTVGFRVICASFHHLMSESANPQKQLFLSKSIDSVPFTWVKTPQYSGNGLKRFINMFTYAWRLWKHDLVKELHIERPDVIIVSSVHPFHYFSGKKWAKHFNAKLLFEVRDLWPLSLIELLNISKYNPLIIFLSFIEKYAYRTADFTISLLPYAKEYMRNKGLDDKHFVYIPNGIEFDVPPVRSDCSAYQLIVLSSLRKEGKFLILYAGAHGEPNGLDVLVETANIFKSVKENIVNIILLGNGNKKKDLMRKASKYNLDNIHFLDPVPRALVPEVLKYADVCFVGSKTTSLYQYGVSPNKVFEYMAAAQPIIWTVDSPKNPVELCGAGICIPPEDPQLLYQTILELKSLDRKELKQIGLKGLEFVQQNHSFEVLSERLIARL